MLNEILFLVISMRMYFKLKLNVAVYTHIAMSRSCKLSLVTFFSINFMTSSVRKSNSCCAGEIIPT